MSDDQSKTRKLATQSSFTFSWEPRTLRRVWLDAMAEASDGFLRSPAFLELMQHGLRTMSVAIAYQQERSDDSSTPTNPVPREGEPHQ